MTKNDVLFLTVSVNNESDIEFTFRVSFTLQAVNPTTYQILMENIYSYYDFFSEFWKLFYLSLFI